MRANGAEAAIADAFDVVALARALSVAASDLVMHQLTALSGGDREANAAIRSTGTRNSIDAR